MTFTEPSQQKSDLVTVYSRHGCHLCDVAVETLENLQSELNFEIEIRYIDGDVELEKLYGEQIPVTQINGEHHDFWRVDPDRFRAFLQRSRQNR